MNKCIFCGTKQDGLSVEETRDWGGYGYYMKPHYYHKSCLLAVLQEPEKYDHKMVDKALYVANLIEIHKKKNQEAKQTYKQLIKGGDADAQPVHNS